MNKTITYLYSAPIARAAAWSFLTRWGRSAVVCAVIIASVGIFNVCTGTVTWLTVGAVLLPITLPLAWASYVKKAVKIADAMPDKTISVTVTDECLCFRTSQHMSEYKWPLIKEVWRFKTLWLLFTYSNQVYTVLPRAALDIELEEFITKAVTENKGIVR
jgi:hypothetical protein